MSKLIHQHSPLILASGSVSRQRLLKEVGLEFDIHLSHLDEEQIKQTHGTGPFEDLALLLARSKALAVSQKYPEIPVIAADQLSVCENRIFDKPLTYERAVSQLQQLNGKTHTLLTAVCIAQNGNITWQYLEPVQLKMRTLTEQSIKNYIQLEKPYNSCGSYHFEGQGKWLFEDVSKHESTVIGLPMLPLLNTLTKLKLVSF